MGGAQTKIQNKLSIGIVGAGPVGLWTAVNILAREHDVNITLYERKDLPYKRGHLLKLDLKNLISELDKYNSDEVKEKLLNFLKTRNSNSNLIATNLLETFLLGIVNETGGVVQYEKIENPFELYKKHDIIIGADGANSLVRRKIFCNELSVRETMQYSILVKFRAKLENKKKEGYLKRVSEMIKNKVIHQILYGPVEADGFRNVTIIVIPSHNEQNIMREISPPTFKNPWNIYDGINIPSAASKIVKNIKEVLASREILPSDISDSAASVNFVELNNYASKNFVKCNNAIWMLVGDAASGVPFFRSLNKGFIEGIHLANEIDNYQNGIITHFDNYENFMQKNTQNEIRRARIYSGAIDVRRKYLTWTGGNDVNVVGLFVLCVIVVAIILLCCCLVQYFCYSNRPISSGSFIQFV
jgi:2-polyprenyl-6-methoxyphenol hydroxylase-like FAD-dependent oxidoreductase